MRLAPQPELRILCAVSTVASSALRIRSACASLFSSAFFDYLLHPEHAGADSDFQYTVGHALVQGGTCRAGRAALKRVLTLGQPRSPLANALQLLKVCEYAVTVQLYRNI